MIEIIRDVKRKGNKRLLVDCGRKDILIASEK